MNLKKKKKKEKIKKIVYLIKVCQNMTFRLYLLTIKYNFLILFLLILL